jgi:hypothetical protein
MTIFVVLMPIPQPALVDEIKKSFPDNYLSLNQTQYLISTRGTTVELATRLGIYDEKQPQKPATGSAVLFATSSYFGRAPTTVWDWIKDKLESAPSG